MFAVLLLLGGIKETAETTGPARPAANATSAAPLTAPDRPARPAPGPVSLRPRVSRSPASSASAKPGGPAATAVTPGKTLAALSCRTQTAAWVSGGARQRLGALEDDLGILSGAAQRFAADRSRGAVTSGDMSSAQSAAARMRSDAQAVGANLGPACVPGLRSDLIAAAGDFSVTGLDVSQAIDQYEAGAGGGAIGEVEAAGRAISQGNAMISAVSAAIARFGG